MFKNKKSDTLNLFSNAMLEAIQHNQQKYYFYFLQLLLHINA